MLMLQEIASLSLGVLEVDFELASDLSELFFSLPDHFRILQAWAVEVGCFHGVYRVNSVILERVPISVEVSAFILFTIVVALGQ
mmetsp:Transcript_28742/g.43408  ORF Transcript_28742/g.43408 Transcript_28742/m.43408 type:complete len:84 (-) Transcript_28742:347-598(-)